MIVLGARGHAKDLEDVMIKSGILPTYFFDDTNVDENLFLGKYKILTSIQELISYSTSSIKLILGTGSPVIRRILYEKTKELNPEYISIISNQSSIASNTTVFGWGLNIMHQVYISNSVTIGNGTLINRGAGIHHDVMIGEFCEIGPGSNILGEVCIGDNVLVGAGATILPKVTICSGTTVGAGAVVTKNITEQGCFVGTPARKIY